MTAWLGGLLGLCIVVELASLWWSLRQLQVQVAVLSLVVHTVRDQLADAVAGE